MTLETTESNPIFELRPDRPFGVITDLRSNQFKLIHPIRFRHSYEDGIYYVKGRHTQLYGYGPTIDEAVLDYTELATGYYQDLTSFNKKELGGNLPRLLRWLTRRIAVQKIQEAA